jgi:hypothetical protein
MNIPKKAKESAINGGWNAPKKGSVWDMVDEVTALDPTFWQALGESLGWNQHRGPCSCLECVYSKEKAWNLIAHRFYDLLLQGQSTEEFWKELLTK